MGYVYRINLNDHGKYGVYKAIHHQEHIGKSVRVIRDRDYGTFELIALRLIKLLMRCRISCDKA